MIPYGRQSISEDDIAEVVRILRSKFLTQGPMVPRFEKAIANYCGVEFGVATSNATAALHIACLSLGVTPGDAVWTSPNSFVASANCALYCGAQVDFVDIDALTYNMSADHLQIKLMAAEKKGVLPKVVIPVHYAGQSPDMAAIRKLADAYGFHIIEDASHAIGATYMNKPVGNCEYSDITVFSFHPVKIITTGEGGMVTTNNGAIANRLQMLRSHGIHRHPNSMQDHPRNEIWNYQQLQLGFNYRMTDIQASLGLSQMNRLNLFIRKRHQIAQHYDKELANLPLLTPWQHPDSRSSYHLYPIRIRQPHCVKTQKEGYEQLHRSNIAANVHYIPIYRHPYFESLGFRRDHCPEAEKFFSETLSLPIFPSLERPEMKFVVREVAKAVS